ncbi:MAG: DUF1684 domain-containing protein [Blastocatellia bacterium]
MTRNILFAILLTSLSMSTINIPENLSTSMTINKLSSSLETPADKSPYQAEIAKWRTETEAKLKSDQGWLSVAGLYWLTEGENRIGTDQSCQVVLPKDSAPAYIGSIVLNKGKAIFQPAKDAKVSVLDKVLTSELALTSDVDGKPEILTINDLSMFLIKRGDHRGDRYGIRLRDKNSPFRKHFTGLTWYEADEKYRVEAKFIPHDQPKTLSVTSIIGDITEEASPGYVVFTIDGQKFELQAENSSGGRLFINFKDLTNGKTTYPAGRFLYTDPPKDGKVILDFNKTVNPPCAFTAYATCPLPPQPNRLSIKIEAGEKTYHYDEADAHK